MDFLTPLFSVLSPLLSPFIQKGFEELSGEAGKDLWAIIKKPFSSEEDKAVIAKVEQNTDLAIQQDALNSLKVLIENRAKSDVSYIGEINDYLSRPDVKIQVNQYGEKSVSVNENKGTINIS